jgi:AraC-like DNA-binding protein
MPNSNQSRINIGAYDQPFSGVGVEYYPTGVKPGRSGVTLHECGYIKNNTKWNYPGVFSPFWRLYYNFDCGHCVLFGDRIIELTPEHIMLIPDHSLFHCLGKNPVPTFWVAFSFVKRPDPALDVPILISPRNTEMCLIRDLQDMIAASDECKPTDAIYRNSLALLQVVLSRPELRWQPPVPDNLMKVVRYIEGNISDRLSNVILAQYACMSVEGFSRAFKHHYGITPARFVTEMRVREAGRLLLQTDKTIEGIADTTGFPNRAYFSRIFKKVTGESPARFRQKHGQL